MMKDARPRPLVLIILDGWGHRDDPNANAIAAARKPNWDDLLKTAPHTLISGSGKCVGLPEGQMGNSEVGHLNMGAGRIVHQDLTRIDIDIENGAFFENPVLIDAIQQAKKTDKALHILGLLSPGGVHSHEKHVHALVTLAAQQQLSAVYLHPILDGRDTPPQSAMGSITALETHCKKVGTGEIVSLIGRYYAMDRDKRWERVQQAYDLLTLAKADYEASTAHEALENAYQRGETDEFVKATIIRSANKPAVKMTTGDIVIFMNFRADRAREITQSLIDPDFKGFARTAWPKPAQFICLAEYDRNFKAPIAYQPESLENIFSEYISHAGLTQLRIAETEKYAHVTFFFNGGVEKPYPGEDRKLIPSPKVATYDLQPEMSAYELTDELVHAIKQKKYDVIVCNFANPDMVGHSGNFEATVKAIEAIDNCFGKIIPAIKEAGGELLITADHGNAEQMFDPQTNQPHTAHTSDPVPFVYLGRPAKIVKTDGKLSDIAPTMLYLMGLETPKQMTGRSLLELVYTVTN